MEQFGLNWNDQRVGELIVILEELSRYEGREGEGQPDPLYKFVDLGYLDRLLAKRNHVLFGSRGAGKSVLFRELQLRCETESIYPIFIPIGAIAQRAYPNIIIEILLRILRSLKEKTRGGFFSLLNAKRRALVHDIDREIQELESLHDRPDEAEVTEIGSSGSEYEGSLGPEISVVKDILKVSAKLSKQVSMSKSKEEKAPWKKIDWLYNRLERYRGLLGRCIAEMNYVAVFLLIDDLYQIHKLHQPFVTDYLKRLVHGLSCYLKIATVRNRSLLYVRSEIAEAGIQVVHDYSSLDLNFELANFSQAKEFVSTIFYNICEGKLGLLRPESLFLVGSSDPMEALTEASGGNPRDFINLLRMIFDSKRRLRETSPISYADIRPTSVAYLNGEIRRELERADPKYEILDLFTREIVDICRSKDDIGFYIANEDIRNYPVVATLIGGLVDSRFIHLLTRSYSPLSDPRQFSTAYSLAMGVYGEYVHEETVNLLSRKNKNQEFPKLPIAEISENYADLVPEISLLKAQGLSGIEQIITG